MNISNVKFLENSFDSFIRLISKLKKMSKLTLVNCTIISYIQFYNLLLSIADHSNISDLVLNCPVEAGSSLSANLIKLVKQILKSNSLCLKTTYTNLPIIDYKMHKKNLKRFIQEELIKFKMCEVYFFEFASLTEFYVNGL